jgi:hypothetical protein
MALFRLEAGGFGVEDDLAHVVWFGGERSCE